MRVRGEAGLASCGAWSCLRRQWPHAALPRPPGLQCYCRQAAKQHQIRGRCRLPPTDAHTQDATETNIINLRRTIYLTIMSAMDFEEAGHKLLKIGLADGQESEVVIMIIECCSQEKTYLKCALHRSAGRAAPAGQDRASP